MRGIHVEGLSKKRGKQALRMAPNAPPQRTGKPQLASFDFAPASTIPAMAPPLDVCVRGAGAVGRTLALLLAAQGLRVGLVKTPAAGAQDAGNRTDIRSYALNDASRSLLESVRAWPGETQATPVASMRVHGDAGGLVRFDAADLGVPAMAWIVDASALEARLEQAMTYQPLVQAMEAAQAATLTVVCEGQASQSRADFGVDFEALPYQQAALAVRVVLDRSHAGTAWQWFANGEVLAFLPTGGASGNSMAVVWSVHVQRLDELAALDDATLAAALEAASHHALGKLTGVGPSAVWPLRMGRASRWVGSAANDRVAGAWALAGDAAHQVHPLAGQGLNLGLADARELAATLGARQGQDGWRGIADMRLLRRYERSRKLALAAPSAALDGLQRLFAVQGGLWREARNAGMLGFDRLRPLKAWVSARAMGPM
jgi:2-polyprenyl-6-methoxyphenol hydroxylase-like FAD-dependent oxidoreductase